MSHREVNIFFSGAWSTVSTAIIQGVITKIILQFHPLPRSKFKSTVKHLLWSVRSTVKPIIYK